MNRTKGTETDLTASIRTGSGAGWKLASIYVISMETVQGAEKFRGRRNEAGSDSFSLVK